MVETLPDEIKIITVEEIRDGILVEVQYEDYGDGVYVEVDDEK